MRLVIQRVKSAKCHIDGACFSAIEQGLMVLVGIGNDDNDEDIAWLAKKLVAMRIFDDEEGVMNRSVEDIGGSIMLISQFTLHAMTKKGNRPSWIKAAPESISRPMYERFIEEVQGVFSGNVATGCFGADMQIELINDGPVTIWMDSKNRE